MRKQILATLLLVLSYGVLYAQDHPYKVVFDLTSKDSLSQLAAVRWAKGVASSNPNAEAEVVMYGKGFELVMPERSNVLEEVREVMKLPRITFTACEAALRNNKVDKKQLLEGTHTVPDGIYEIVAKQRQGWAYIKVAR